MRHVDPFQRHRQRVLAATASGVAASIGYSVAGARLAANDAGPPSAAGTEYRRQLAQLLHDRQRLKQIQSRQTKIELKRELIPAYDAWVEGVLEATENGQPGVQDDVLVTMMIWRIDVGDYAAALPLIAYCLKWGLQLPGHFKRTLAAFAVEEIAEAAVRALAPSAERPSTDLVKATTEALAGIERLTHDSDMPDEVRATLHKAIAMAILAGGEEDGPDRRLRESQALKRYQLALDLDPRSGVKGDIGRLQRSLNKEPPSGSADASSDAAAAEG
ncbi:MULTISPECIES: phage terminase small subunit [Brevundimonas]|uniref:phage terminase small subunit n=1 Tax=Brevundimonas TaxID=41275 RepID=UPI002580CB33|nr:MULTISPECIES: phage terminase small subunit [Brevundimonas]